MKRTRLEKRDLTDQYAWEYLSSIGTPRALAVWLLYAHREHRQLVDMDLPIEQWVHHGGIDYARGSYRATKLLAKADFLSLGIDTKQVALATGLECERMNRETNLRLRRLRHCHDRDDEFNAILHRAARHVSRVLGPLDLALRDMRDGGWSPGRTSAVRSPRLHSYWKFQAEPDSSPAASHLASQLIAKTYQWSIACSGKELRAVDYATATTVPKNAKTDRLICYEPHMNIRLQLPVGEYIIGRLKRKLGIDLRDQSANQEGAKRGSKDGSLATLDLSSASDTLSLELVYDLLPPDWWGWLNAIRSRKTKWPDGSVTVNEKFSSMGNGFTFPLETLVFYALVKATMEHHGDEWADPLVYGDDIIVPTQHALDAVRVLRKAGFTINEKKSFSSGYFRESCGADWYAGVSFKAPRLEKRVDRVATAMSFHNRAFEAACLNSIDDELLFQTKRSDAMLRRLRVLANCFSDARPLGPAGLGDGHFWCGWSAARPSLDRRKAIKGWCTPWAYSTWATLSGEGIYRNTEGPSSRSSDAAALCAALDSRPQSPNSVRARRRVVLFCTSAMTWPEVYLVR